MLCMLSATLAQAIDIEVRTPDGALISGVGFRWTLQEDKTWDVVPGKTGTTLAPSLTPPRTPGETLSLQFHRSHMPVIESGQTANTTGTASTAAPLVAGTRYFVSVLPFGQADGTPVYQMGGAPIVPTASGTLPSKVVVMVNRLPTETAQISVLLYHDSNPINNQPDAMGTQEYGLCGFEMQVYDAGGTYGASGGRIAFDAFGNPLGTTYKANGDVDQIGPLVLRTDRNGVFRVKNLAPAKYTIFALPPQEKPSQADCPGYYGANPQTPWPAAGQAWMQTHTIEGTQGVDAWVKANEPAYFKEFGPPGHHVFIGFVPSFSAAGGVAAARATGRVVNIHMSRPPNFQFFNGPVVTECSVGLNESASLAVGGGRGVYAGKCNPDGTFDIPGLKPNTRYQLTVWDKALDNVFGIYDFLSGPAGQSANLGDVPVFNWFGRLEGKVCNDPLETGYCAQGSTGIPGQAVNIRFRDGSIYQSVLTDDEGQYEFPEVFPFFNWMVAEVDFARYKATGATSIADAGGQLPAAPVWPNRGKTTPYPGPDGVRTETGPVLLEGIQLFLGQTNIIDWGKKAYAPGETGGISGIVHYASTRAESDPRFAFAENNEPGVPGVTVRLYRADPLNPKVAAGPVIAEVTTDAWDNALPSGCQGDAYTTRDGVATDCYDGLRNFNQIRTAVFDGGYAFNDLPPGNYITEVVLPPGYEVQKEEDKNVDFGDTQVVSTLALPPECVGAMHTVPAELDLFPGVTIPPEYGGGGGQRPLCDRKAVTLAAGQNAASEFHIFTKAPIAGHIVGMILDDLANEFDPHAPAFGEKYAPPFMPVSLRDAAGREFSRVYSDRFGTYNALVPSTFSYNIPIPSGVAPNMVTACLNSPYMPVKDPSTGLDVLDSITGKPVMQLDPHFNKSYSQFCYTFQYLPGKTTYLDTPVLPIASFAGPQQYSLDCEAPAGVPGIRSVNGSTNVGPWIASTGQQLTITSQGLKQVLNPAWDSEDPAKVVAGNVVPKTIARDFGFGNSPGSISLGGLTLPASSIVSWNNDQIVLNVPAQGTDANSIVTTVMSGTLLVTRGDNGNVTPRGVTVHIGGVSPTVVRAGGSIQAAIEAASEGALITVEPGIYEESVIIDKRIRLQGYGAGSSLINAVKQPVEKLQAWRLLACQKVVAPNGERFLLPGQAAPTGATAAERLNTCITGDTADNAPLLFGDEEGPGVFVMLKSNGAANPQPVASTVALQIDGFTISGADQGGGINVNGYATGLEISNNLITGNQGIMAGGIRIGNPALTTADLPVGSRNTNVRIHHNEITQNGDTAGQVAGGGGGIGIYYGATNYYVSKNLVCGNFSTGNGGGMAHLGVSDGGVIDSNRFLWNASFNQGASVQGGGVSIAGQNSQAAGTGLSTGSGNVRISNNQFLGNMAGAGDGGGISLVGTNGNELTAANRQGYRVDIFNNEIANNAAGVAGGGISLLDSVNVRIWNNTIAHNDSTATAARAFSIALRPNIAAPTPNLLNASTAQPGAGIAAYTHSPVLTTRLLGVGGLGALVNPRTYYSDADLRNNVVWQNRKFHFAFTDYGNTACTVNNANTCYGLVSDGFDDLAVIGSPVLLGQPVYKLKPTSSVLTSLAYYNPLVNPNVAGNPLFIATELNGPRDAIVQQLEQSVLPIPSVAAAFDEGGNFIDLRYGPLTLRDPATLALYRDFNVPLGTSSANAAIARGQVLSGQPNAALLAKDKDGATRVPAAGRWPVGAYQPK